MSIGQETKDRIHQFAGKQAVSGYIDSLMSEGQSQPGTVENHAPSSHEVTGLIYRGFITIGTVSGALTGYISSGGRQRFSSGGWIDTFIGMAAGLMIGVGFGQLGSALFAVAAKKEK